MSFAMSPASLIDSTGDDGEDFGKSHVHLLNPLWFMNSQMRPIQV